MKDKKLTPIHPGEILKSEFLEPMQISQYRLAKDISVPPPGELTKLFTDEGPLPQTQP
jgi:addiction module HigA family antidote